MPNVRLSRNRVEALEPRKSPYDIRDAELKGFGIRVCLREPNATSFIASTKDGASGRPSATPTASVSMRPAGRQRN